MSRHNVASRGVVRVKKEKCETCIFRPGNVMGLRPGRVAGMVRDTRADEGVIPCHETYDLEEQAVCRGFYELEPKPGPLQIAERLGCIEEVPS